MADGDRERLLRPARARPAAAAAARYRADFIAKVGLAGFEQHYPKQLSVRHAAADALARALAEPAAVLLMDEPFGALDNQTRELMQELLLGIWEAQRKTVL